MTNCKNCGAPLPANGKCEYCGTFYAPLDIDKLLYVLLDARSDAEEMIEITSLSDTERKYIRVFPKS